MGKERKDKEFSAGEQEIQAVFARLCPLVTDALSLEKCELKLSDRPADLGADSLDMLIVAGKAENLRKNPVLPHSLPPAPGFLSIRGKSS